MTALGLNQTMAAAPGSALLFVMPSAEQAPLSGPKGDAAGGPGAARAHMQTAGAAPVFHS